MPNNLTIINCFAQFLTPFLYTVAMVGDGPYQLDSQGNECCLSTTIETEWPKVNFAAGILPPSEKVERQGGLMVSALVSGLSSLGSSPG